MKIGEYIYEKLEVKTRGELEEALSDLVAHLFDDYCPDRYSEGPTIDCILTLLDHISGYSYECPTKTDAEWKAAVDNWLREFEEM